MTNSEIRKELNGKMEVLSELEIDRLAEILGMSFLDDDMDKNDKIFAISSEQKELELDAALKKLEYEEDDSGY
jgi:hypothetical protein